MTVMEPLHLLSTGVLSTGVHEHVDLTLRIVGSSSFQIGRGFGLRRHWKKVSCWSSSSWGKGRNRLGNDRTYIGPPTLRPLAPPAGRSRIVELGDSEAGPVRGRHPPQRGRGQDLAFATAPGIIGLPQRQRLPIQCAGRGQHDRHRLIRPERPRRRAIPHGRRAMAA